MTPSQKSFVRHLRVFGWLLVAALFAMALLADPSDNPPEWETLPDSCVQVLECSGSDPVAR